MAAVLVVLFFLIFFGAMIAGLVFWIMKIIEVVQIPDPQYRIAGTDKTTWVLIVILLGWIGALVWQFAKRDDVLRAASALGAPGLGAPGFGAPGFGPPGLGPPPPVAAPPPGWYPEPGTGWFAYWDGRGWTGARQPPQGLPPSGQFSPGFGGQAGTGGQQFGTGPQPSYGTQPGPSLEKRPD